MATDGNSARGSLRRQREAVLRWERECLQGRPLPLERLLSELPDGLLNVSPLLLQASGRVLFDEGRLAEARSSLEQAVKGLAAMYLTPNLPSAMADLAEAHWRMGDRAAAATLLTFLADEYNDTPAEQRSGELARILAIGGEVAGSRVCPPLRLFYEALDRFEQAGRIDEACRTTTDMWGNVGGELTEEDWRMLAWRLERWKSLHEGARLQAELLSVWQSLHGGRWADALLRLRALLPLEGRLPYYAAAKLESACLLCTAYAEPQTADQQAERIRAIRLRYPADLRLQYDLVRGTARALSVLGRHDEAAAQEREGRLFARLLGIPAEPEEPTVRPDTATVRGGGQRIVETSAESGAQAWQVRLFGGLSLRRGTEELRDLHWKRKKSRELLVYLLLQPGYAAPKEQAMEALAFGEEVEKSQQALYVAVHHLKRALREELALDDGVTMRNGIVSLREDAFDYVDAERYTALIRVADRLWERDRELSVELYREACELYDELLPELPYPSWLARIRDQLAGKHADLLRKCALYAAGRDDWSGQEIYLREWIRFDPYHEEPYELLLDLLRRTERTAEAERLHARWTAICKEELDVEMSSASGRAAGGAGA